MRLSFLIMFNLWYGGTRVPVRRGETSSLFPSPRAGLCSRNPTFHAPRYKIQITLGQPQAGNSLHWACVSLPKGLLHWVWGWPCTFAGTSAAPLSALHAESPSWEIYEDWERENYPWQQILVQSYRKKQSRTNRYCSTYQELLHFLS